MASLYYINLVVVVKLTSSWFLLLGSRITTCRRYITGAFQSLYNVIMDFGFSCWYNVEAVEMIMVTSLGRALYTPDVPLKHHLCILFIEISQMSFHENS